MSNTCTAILGRDGEWHIAYCPEVPGANGQGRTKHDATESPASAARCCRLRDALEADDHVPRR